MHMISGAGSDEIMLVYSLCLQQADFSWLMTYYFRKMDHGVQRLQIISNLSICWSNVFIINVTSESSQR